MVRSSTRVVRSRGVNPRAGYMTQEDNLLPWRTAIRNGELALKLKGVPRQERKQKALAYLDRVSLAGFEQHYPIKLPPAIADPSVITYNHVCAEYS